jgi:hypothetical protein
MSEMTTTRYYPFDTAALSKGSRVPRSTIESAYNIRHADARYGIKAFLPARQYVERALAERDGELVTIICDAGDLVILTDPEASAYNDRRILALLVQAGESHRRMAGVDRSKLGDDVAEHDRALVTHGRALQAAGRIESRNLIPQPRVRQTPELAGAVEKDS